MMDRVDKNRRPAFVTPPSKLSNTDLPYTLGRKRSGIYGESTEAEQLGVLPQECTRVKDAMSRSVSVVTPWTKVEEAVQLMKSLDVGGLIVCDGSTLVGTLCDRDIALANAPPSETVQKIITPDPVSCLEDDLLIDAHAMIRAHGLTALPVRDSRGLLTGILMRAAGTTVIFLLLAPLLLASWGSLAMSADLTPVPPAPLESRPDNPQGSNPPPSRIDPGIERRPQTVPHPSSSVTPPNIDPKMAIDPETAPPAREKTQPGSSKEPPKKPSAP